MTDYVILKATNESGTIFAIEGDQRARSPEGAVRLWCSDITGDDDTSILAAVPKRSWSVLKVEREVRETTNVTRL